MWEYTTTGEKGTAPEVQRSLDELAREGARRMIAEALEVEVERIREPACDMSEMQDGHAQVVRNGRAQERTLTLGGRRYLDSGAASR